jgi:hypothetical protein
LHFFKEGFLSRARGATDLAFLLKYEMKWPNRKRVGVQAPWRQLLRTTVGRRVKRAQRRVQRRNRGGHRGGRSVEVLDEGAY